MKTSRPTAQQLGILQLYEQACCYGHGMKEVRARLGLSPKTVEFHLGRLRESLGIKSLQGLISWAFRSGLVYGVFFLLSTAQAQSAGSTVTLGWTLSSTPGIASQTISFGPATQTYTNSIVLGPTIAQFQLTNLVAGGTYFVALKATSTNGLSSAYSAEAVIGFPAPPTTIRIIGP